MSLSTLCMDGMNGNGGGGGGGIAFCKGDGGNIELMIVCIGGGGGGGIVVFSIGVGGGGGGGGGGDGNVLMKLFAGGGGGDGILEMSVDPADDGEIGFSIVRDVSDCTRGEGGGGGGGIKDCSDVVDIEMDVDLLFEINSGGSGGVGHGAKSWLDLLV